MARSPQEQFSPAPSRPHDELDHGPSWFERVLAAGFHERELQCLTVPVIFPEGSGHRVNVTFPLEGPYSLNGSGRYAVPVDEVLYHGTLQRQIAGEAGYVAAKPGERCPACLSQAAQDAILHAAIVRAARKAAR